MWLAALSCNIRRKVSLNRTVVIDFTKAGIG